MCRRLSNCEVKVKVLKPISPACRVYVDALQQRLKLSVADGVHEQYRYFRFVSSLRFGHDGK